jgi:hypothetical protein
MCLYIYSSTFGLGGLTNMPSVGVFDKKLYYDGRMNG